MLISLILRKCFTVLPQPERLQKRWNLFGISGRCVVSGKKVGARRIEPGGMNHAVDSIIGLRIKRTGHITEY